jgi:hypothetical protein
VAGVLGGDDRDLAQDAECTKRYILKVADRRANYIQGPHSLPLQATPARHRTAHCGPV